MKLTEYTAMDLYTVKNAVKIKILYSKSSRSVSRDFRPLFFSWFESIWAALIKSLQGFQIIFRFRQDTHKLFSRCAANPGVKQILLVNQHFILQIFSFTPKRISLDFPFKSNQRKSKISILTPRHNAHCGDRLSGVMHIGEIVSTEWCTAHHGVS